VHREAVIDGSDCAQKSEHCTQSIKVTVQDSVGLARVIAITDCWSLVIGHWLVVSG